MMFLLISPNLKGFGRGISVCNIKVIRFGTLSIVTSFVFLYALYMDSVLDISYNVFACVSKYVISYSVFVCL